VKTKFSAFIISLLIAVTAYSQKGHNIEFKINGLANDTVYLAYHYGSKVYVEDTLVLDKQGITITKGNDTIPSGLYLLFLPSGKYFDLIIDKDQHFYFENDTSNFIQAAKIKGSDENLYFYEYQQNLEKKYTELDANLVMLESAFTSADSIKIKAKIELIETEIETYRTETNKKHANYFYTKLILSSKHPEPPKKLIESSTDSLFAYRYYKTHYFDYTDFTDVRMLRTPTFEKSILTYLNQLIALHPDSAILECEQMLDKAKGNYEIWRFVLTAQFQVFNRSSIMGMDKVFIYLSDKYFLTEKVNWVSPEFKTQLKNHIEIMKPSLIGNIAPDLKLPTADDKFVRISDTEADYTILYFWDVDCGHCAQEIPELNKFYKENKSKKFEIIAIYTQLDKQKWMDFIDKEQFEWINCWDPDQVSNMKSLYYINSTPVIYLLDKDKRILLKRITLEVLKQYLKPRIN